MTPHTANVAKVVGNKGSGDRRLSEKERERKEVERDKKGLRGGRDSQTKSSSQGPEDLVGARMKGASMTSLSQNLYDNLESSRDRAQLLNEFSPLVVRMTGTRGLQEFAGISSQKARRCGED